MAVSHQRGPVCGVGAVDGLASARPDTSQAWHDWLASPRARANQEARLGTAWLETSSQSKSHFPHRFRYGVQAETAWSHS